MDESAACIFCKMMKGEESCRKLYEDENTLSILDIGQMALNPDTGELVRGRCLVIPKRHVIWFYELEDEELGKLFIATKSVIGKINRAFNPDFVTIFLRGQRVPHAHIILQPSFKGDAMENTFKVLSSPSTIAPEALLDEMAQKIREGLRANP
jgi:histidine triad (HIT) family protein